MLDQPRLPCRQVVERKRRVKAPTSSAKANTQWPRPSPQRQPSPRLRSSANPGTPALPKSTDVDVQFAAHRVRRLDNSAENVGRNRRASTSCAAPELIPVDHVGFRHHNPSPWLGAAALGRQRGFLRRFRRSARFPSASNPAGDSNLRGLAKHQISAVCELGLWSGAHVLVPPRAPGPRRPCTPREVVTAGHAHPRLRHRRRQMLARPACWMTEALAHQSRPTGPQNAYSPALTGRGPPNVPPRPFDQRRRTVPGRRGREGNLPRTVLNCANCVKRATITGADR